jgi:hypothetical protein
MRVASAEIVPYLCQPARLVSELPFKGFEGLQPVYAY